MITPDIDEQFRTHNEALSVFIFVPKTMTHLSRFLAMPGPARQLGFIKFDAAAVSGVQPVCSPFKCFLADEFIPSWSSLIQTHSTSRWSDTRIGMVVY